MMRLKKTITIRDIFFYLCHPIKYRVAKRAHLLLRALLSGNYATISKYSSTKIAIDFMSMRLEFDALSVYYSYRFYHHQVSYYFNINKLCEEIENNRNLYSTEEILAFNFFDRLSMQSHNIILTPYEESIYELLIGIVHS